MACYLCSPDPRDTRVPLCADCRARRSAAIAAEHRAKAAARAAHEAAVDTAHIDEARAIDEALKLNRESEWLRDNPHRIAEEGDRRTR